MQLRGFKQIMLTNSMCARWQLSQGHPTMLIHYSLPYSIPWVNDYVLVH